jgi:uncharacterized protein
MRFKKADKIYFVRIDSGEEIVAVLQKVCEENQIRLGRISAIGAVSQATIGFFEMNEKKYHSTVHNGDLEITSLLGNITTMNDKIYLHIHINLAGEDNRTIGGHLNEAIVSATCEVIIEEFKGEVSRKLDDDIGINLLEL